MVRISDARMSGTSYGACVLHVAPEALRRRAAGAGAGRRPDRARRAGRARSTLQVADDELARRRAAWTPPAAALRARLRRDVRAAHHAGRRGLRLRLPRRRRAPTPSRRSTEAMELPPNRFKRALKAGRHADRPVVEPVQPHLGRGPRRRRASTGCCSTPSTRPTSCRWSYSQLQARSAGPAHRVVRAALERHGDDEAPARHRRAELPRPYVQTAAEAKPRGRGDPLSAGRRARLRRHDARLALRPRQGLPRARRRGDLRAACRSRPRARWTTSRRSRGVEGVDGVFIGPGDLSAAMGHLGRDRPSRGGRGIEDAIRRIRACREGARHPDRRREAGAALHRGWAACSSPSAADIGILVKGSEQLAQRFKGGA